MPKKKGSQQSSEQVLNHAGVDGKDGCIYCLERSWKKNLGLSRRP